MGLTRATITELREIKKYILAHPEDYHQRTYGRIRFQADGKTPCGTMCCIAGHAIRRRVSLQAYLRRLHSFWGNTRFGKYKNGFNFHAEAKGILGLTEDQAERLFDSNMPTQEMRLAYQMNFNNPAERAKIGAKRIELFIRSKGEV